MGHVRPPGRFTGAASPAHFTGSLHQLASSHAARHPVTAAAPWVRSACFKFRWRGRPALLDCAFLLPCCSFVAHASCLRLLPAFPARRGVRTAAVLLLHCGVGATGVAIKLAVCRALRRYALPPFASALASSALIRSRSLSRLRSNAALLFHSPCSTAGNALVYRPGFNSDFDTPDFAVMIT
jgi:hypothetical protein